MAPLSLEDVLNEEFLSMAQDARETAGIVADHLQDSDPFSGQAVMRHPDARLAQPPSALHFSRKVAAHWPVIIQGVPQKHFPRAWEKWKSSAYLRKQMAAPSLEGDGNQGPRKVKVALTPNGHADDIVEAPEGKQGKVFALPHEEDMTFEELFQALNARKTDKNAPVAYLQSQDSNLTKDQGAGDFSLLLADLQWTDARDGSLRTDIDWASEVLGNPEATNLWIGASDSVTSMHKDHYENVFSCVRGKKTFRLYPPWESYFVEGDEVYDVYRWKWNGPGAAEAFVLEPTNLPPTPWIPIDPNLPANHPRNLAHPGYTSSRAFLKPIHVTLQAGETLYLPAGWYHSVIQMEDDGGIDGGEDNAICLCVNWWYNCEVNDRDVWSSFNARLAQRSREDPQSRHRRDQ